MSPVHRWLAAPPTSVRVALFCLWLFAALGACASEAPQHRARHGHHRRHRHRRHHRPRTVVLQEGPAPPRTRILRRVCAPVAHCGQFAGCALAEEQPDPDAPGQVRYLVKRYDPDPSRVDSVFEWGQLCWTEPSGRSCVDAFQRGTRCAQDETPALSTAPPPRCEVQAGVCGAVGGDPDAGAPGPPVGPAVP